MISFEEVSFSYDGQHKALDGVTLQVPQGSFVCILGGNGSGKSTLAKHINALLLPDEGSVRVAGRDTGEAANLYFVRSTAGMVFQNPDDQLVASLVENDVAFGPENLGVPSGQLRERVTMALETVGLQGFEMRETHALSGGQKQRVAIAGVLAMHPRILVLDEASAMLDPRGRRSLMRVIDELHSSGLTVVLITHFMEEAALADVVYVLENGKVALAGPPRQVLADPVVLESLSLDVPFAAKMSQALQERGVPVGLHVGEAELVEELAGLLQSAPAEDGVGA